MADSVVGDEIQSSCIKIGFEFDKVVEEIRVSSESGMIIDSEICTTSIRVINACFMPSWNMTYHRQ